MRKGCATPEVGYVSAWPSRARNRSPREEPMSGGLNTLRYQNRTGCQWAFLPHDLAPKSTAYEYFKKYRDHGVWQRVVDALRAQVRQDTPQAPGKDGMREPTPSAVCVDSQSVKTTEVGASTGRTRRNRSAAASGTSSWTPWGSSWR